MLKRAVLVISVFALTALPATAKPTLALSPDPPHVGELNTLSGCGFIPSIEVEAYIRWNEDFKRDWGQGVVQHAISDASGCFVMSWTPPVVGLYGIWIEQVQANGKELSRGVRLIFEVH